MQSSERVIEAAVHCRWIHQWLDALRDSKLICYVYAPRAFAHYVNIAAEIVFARRFSAFSRNLRDAYSRCDRRDVDALKKKLFAKYDRAIQEREDPPIAGLWFVLSPPSFMTVDDKLTYQLFLRDSFQRKEALLREHSGQVVAFYRKALEDESELFAVHIDLIGSSKVVESQKQILSEADARLLMLQTLQQYVLATVGNADAAFLPLKTAGDAVLCVAACVPDKLDKLVEAMRALTFKDGWKDAIERAMSTAGWKLEGVPPPLLRVTVARGDVRWLEELHDLLGTSVTAMFVLEADLKREGGEGPMIAWLGNWAEFVGDRKQIRLNHKKVGDVDVFIDAPAAEAKPDPPPSTVVPNAA